MELDIYISETLKSIIKGINDTQIFARENDARINPRLGNWDKDKCLQTYKGNEEGIIPISVIDFDIAITVSNENEKGGKVGINVFSANVSGKVANKDINETYSRIKFSLNIALPTDNSLKNRL